MKTPRQTILDRHRAVASQLDAVRRTALNAVFNVPDATREDPANAIRHTPRAGLLMLWQELILPARRIWIGLATVWVAIFVLRLAAHDDAVSILAQSAVSPPRPAMLLHDQQRLWVELAGGAEVVPVTPPKTAPQKPRGEGRGRTGAG